MMLALLGHFGVRILRLSMPTPAARLQMHRLSVWLAAEVEHKVEGKTSMLLMIAELEEDAEELAERRLETIIGAHLFCFLLASRINVCVTCVSKFAKFADSMLVRLC